MPGRTIKYPGVEKQIPPHDCKIGEFRIRPCFRCHSTWNRAKPDCASRCAIGRIQISISTILRGQQLPPINCWQYGYRTEGNLRQSGGEQLAIFQTFYGCNAASESLATSIPSGTS
jgi:hypothetical protein